MNAYLLAGGFSRRFGEDKTLYPFRGTPLILSLFRKVSRHFPTWVIAKNLTKYENLNLPLLKDLYSDLQTPLVGILTGLAHSDKTFNLFLSADLPLLDDTFLRFVKNFSYSGRYLGFIPSLGGKYHFTCGVYSKRLLPLLEEAIKKKNLSMKQFLDFFYIWEEDYLLTQGVNKNVCFNLNTKRHLEILKQLQLTT
jgi:molybdopterin-guanine dinucleotide biosynthesis protein A